MMSIEYRIKQILDVPMRFEELNGKKVAIYELAHKKALRKLLQVLDISEITAHTMFIVPGRYIWERTV